MKIVDFDPAQLDPKLVTQRRTAVVSLVLLLTGPAVMLMADLHWRAGYDAWKIAHLAIFTVLFALIAFGAAQAIIGFRLRRRGGDRLSISHSVAFERDTEPLSARTAVIMPICNEDVTRVIEGLRVAYESVVSTGQLPECDFFLLSDSKDPNTWIEEEAAWLALTQQLGAQGRIFYRKRRVGINKKAGNVADFCRRWGRHYRYMVVLDADSIITGAAIVQLVRMMERNPRVGIIQGVPLLANGETILARLQQFASRLYSPISAAGLNYWQLGEGNYWGHNAIIRVQPFMRHCSLPELPGDGPFGGRILSHDYVEAALMRRAGWQVWLATDLAGNYEECPANIIDFAKRDRRWLQGNLQHARLIIARGFHFVNRVHFTLGILSYLASALWFSLLVLSAAIAWHATGKNSAPLHATGFSSVLHGSATAQALGLFGFTVGLLFLPKVLALLDLRRRPDAVAAFGGWKKLLTGVVSETVIFTFLAPVLMMFHTKFIVLTLCRCSITWGSQRRGRAGASAWREASLEHSGHTAVGLIAAYVVFRIDPRLAAWMSPVLGGLIFSIPLSFLTGSLDLGLRLQRLGLFTTPEETAPPSELTRLNAHLAARQRGDHPVPPELAADYGLLQAVLDPYVNAAHLSLLRAKDDPPAAIEERFSGLREKLLREGPTALRPRDKLALLSDFDSMTALHEELWAAPASDLAAWWQRALGHYTVITPPPETAFDRPSVAA